MMQMMGRFGGKDSNDECFAHGLAFHFFFCQIKNRKQFKVQSQKQKTIQVQTSKTENC